jgi:trehalose 6-phosphate synthase/phosphatase
VKGRGGEWVRPAALSADWKPAVRAVMADYAGRLPGSFVEEKEFTLAWHYRLADPELGPARARELADTLIHLTETAPLHVVEGRKVIEVRPAGVNKGVAAQPFLARGYDFVLAVGDDTTDEDLFRVLPRSAESVRVGLTSSYARFNVYDQPQLRRLLEDLAAAAGPGEPAASDAGLGASRERVSSSL